MNARPVPRVPRGFRDLFSADVSIRREIIDVILGVYRRYGFEPLETPAVEYADVLGKYLPESDTPEGGVFSLRDDDGQWVALRYDLTAPLSRIFAQHGKELIRPFRRYQVGPVWRQEKTGPGRFREFYQCDFDTVGTSSMAADAEVCAVAASCFEDLGIDRGEYLIKVNDRKILNGLLDVIGLPADAEGEGPKPRLGVLRTIDKLDRLGTAGVRELLGEGRLDVSGDYTRGTALSSVQVDVVMGYLGVRCSDREVVCQRLRELVGGSKEGVEGVRELEEIHEHLEAMDLGPDQVVFEPSIVRGLAYYTGPVFEAELTFEAESEDRQRRFGSVLGGGRYDDLVERFTGTRIPATGASVGIDRLLAALEDDERLGSRAARGPVVVTVFDRERMGDYQRMATELRTAGIPTEVYLGSRGVRAQVKYADRRASPVAIIAGSDEFDRGEVTLKDLRLGARLSQTIQDREQWTKGRPAQVSVPRTELVAATHQLLEQMN